MDLVALLEYIVKSLVKNPDSVIVSVSDEEGYKLLTVQVEEEDVASVIGKGGKIANAIRTLVQASSYYNKLDKVRINIEAKEK